MVSPVSSSTERASASTRRARAMVRCTRRSRSERSGRCSRSARSLPMAMYMKPGWYTCSPPSSTRVTDTSPASIRRRSRRARRLAASVPPTPPPITTMRSMSAPLLDDELVVSVAGLDADEAMTRLLDPGRDVDPRSGVAGPHGDHVADRPLSDGPDQLHERSGAVAAAGVHGPVHGDFDDHHRSAPFTSDEQRGDAVGDLGQDGGGARRLLQ